MDLTRPTRSVYRDMLPADWSIIILAGGRGTRIASLGPKPLIQLGGRALIEPILECALQITPNRTVVVVSETTQVVAEKFADPRRQFVQLEPLGTGYCVLKALEKVDTPHVLVAQADDSFFLKPETLEALAVQHVNRNAVFTVGVAHVTGEVPYAWVEHDGMKLVRIHKQLTDLQKSPPKGIVAGLYAGEVEWLRTVLPTVPPNSKGEVGLPSVVDLGLANNEQIDAFVFPGSQWQGVNTPEELRAAERKLGVLG